MGQPLVTLDINGMNICMSTFECMEKKDFNKKMLIASYPDTILENIFRGEPIFDKKGLKKNSSGFTQNIKENKKYDIRYSVSKESRVFNDKINKIKIKVKVR
jgi:hypothetical protein